jgi:FKBP-type peptidyl-prolyl cis-trans isomerase
MKSSWATLLAFGILCGRCFAASPSPSPSPAVAPSPGAAGPRIITLSNLGLPPAKSTAGPLLKDARSRASYAIGLQVGGQLREQADIDVDPDAVGAGVRDAMAKVEPALSEKARDEALQEFAKGEQTKHLEKMKVEAEKNKKDGEAFLAENKKKPGVVTLPSGLQYQIIKDATGPKPKATEQVVANYKGTLIDGTQFDSSYDRGRPATFPLQGVIKGWTEGVPLMSVGAKYKFWVPSDLAYGPRGRGKVIGPNSTLVFEIELVKIVSP